MPTPEEFLAGYQFVEVTPDYIEHIRRIELDPALQEIVKARDYLNQMIVNHANATYRPSFLFRRKPEKV